MKILFLSHKFYPEIGGIEVNSEILANAFHNEGHEIKLLTWTPDPGIKTFPFEVIRNPPLSVLLKEHRWAEVVFENNPSLRLAWPGFFLRKPFVVALRTWINRMDGKIAWQDKLKLGWLKQASAVIAVSDAVRKKCWPSATVIGNPYRQEVFKILPGIDRSIDFVFLGRLVSDKGADLAIKAIAGVLKAHPVRDKVSPHIALTVVGDGPELAILKNLAIDSGVQDNVEFTGALKGSALVNCLNKHRFILVPSVWEEPFGNVALEGMACGCVPIVSDGGGLVDAVGDAGLTFSRGSVDSLLSSILNILNNPGLEKRLRDAAGDHLQEHQPEIVSKRYLSVIKGALKR